MRGAAVFLAIGISPASKEQKTTNDPAPRRHWRILPSQKPRRKKKTKKLLDLMTHGSGSRLVASQAPRLAHPRPPRPAIRCAGMCGGVAAQRIFFQPSF